MKSNQMKSIIYLSGILAFASCDNKSNTDTVNVPSNSRYIPGEYKKANMNNNIITDSSESFLFYLGKKGQYVHGTRQSFTLEEIWDEAEDLRFDAESVLNNARSLGCDSAIEAAENAINYSDDCTSSRNYSEAESYLDDVQSELNNAQSLLDDCESIENNDGEDEE